jgi:hypothetical protein
MWWSLYDVTILALNFQCHVQGFLHVETFHWIILQIIYRTRDILYLYANILYNLTHFPGILVMSDLTGSNVPIESVPITTQNVFIKEYFI